MPSDLSFVTLIYARVILVSGMEEGSFAKRRYVNMRALGVFLLLPGWDASPPQGYPYPSPRH